jgi:ABC-type multidrug transport system fused ATPase/permease subunit
LVRSRLKTLSILVAGRWSTLLFLYLTILVCAGLESFGIASFYPLVDILQDASKLAYYESRLFALFPRLEPVLGGSSFVTYILLSVGALFVGKNLIFVLATYKNNWLLTDLFCSWITRIFRNYLKKPYSFFVEHQAGDLIQRQLMQTRNTAAALGELLKLFATLVTVVLLCVLLLTIVPGGILVIVLVMTAIFSVVMILSRRRLYDTGVNIVEMEKRGFALATEALSGIRQIKIFGTEEHYTDRLQVIWERFGRHMVLRNFFTALPRPALETLLVICGLLVMHAFLDGSGREGTQLMPMFTVLGVALLRMLPLIAGASSQIMNVASTWHSAEVVAALLATETPTTPGKVLPLFRRSLVVEHVNFCYKEQEPVLTDINMEFQQQRFYGIVGASGSGKSTLIDLLTGFYNPQRGRVLVDGVDLVGVDMHSWRAQLGVISQETFLFSGTMEDNICFGIDAEKRDLERMREAARISYADEFIQQLPEGYQTLVGERGVKLSGGQRQRLAIARAIYLDPPILILDEATSSLDRLSEQKVREAIELLHGKRTVIVIAHNLATVAGADHIYVIENGQLAEQGSHEELHAGEGLYSRLCAGQKLE